MKNLKLKWKLLVSYGVILLLLLVLGITSISVVNMMSKKSIEYAEEIVPVVEEIGLARRNMISVRRYLLNAIIANDQEDYQRVVDSMNTDRDALYAGLDAIEQLDPAYSSAVNAVREKLKSVAEYNTQIMELSKDFGNVDSIYQAYDIYLNEYAPVFTEAADMMQALNTQIDQNVSAQEMMVKDVRRIAIAIVIIIFTIAVVAVVVFTVLMLRYIMIPTRKLLEGADALARGDFQNASVDYPSKDEFGTLANEITSVMNRIVFITKDLQDGLRAVGEGRFDARSSDDSQYEGEYHYLRDSVYHLIHMLNNIMCQIHAASSEVSSSAEQIANGAQALSQGSTEQASSVQELAATLSDISYQVNENTQLVDETEKKVRETVEEVTLGTDRMRQMLTAMQNIGTTSSEISKIIKNIEDIAFQTNILALNAAVEAARAGNAGKGFAVVADEVRRLAANTAEASKNTGELISKALQAVEQGKSIADETAASLERVNSIIEQLAAQAGKVASNSQAQDNAIQQISEGVEQISAVVQNNSATAEESAAASEELSSQAHILKELVSRFNITCDRTVQQEVESAAIPAQAPESVSSKY
ncbi:methyl-accepting chemotaxis protein [Candidatus Agathobaculum pullicola]|uniref:methyl-accepting chemotaxis protein n=1 Tax=Candidatus Agathobaculum pullicola TaxID=2838426 RepID=UPI003F8F100B